MTDTVELRAGRARAVIAPSVGGAIAAFEYDGLPILRPTPAEALAVGAVRLFACYPLIPFSNRIAGATLHWNGNAHRLPRYLAEEPHAIHGNGWRRAWQLIDQARQAATLELLHDANGDAALQWPFPYRARQTFELSPNALTLDLTIENTGDAEFPFGLGWHPFFPRNAATELEFAARGIWQTDATRLPTHFERTPAPWDFAAQRPIGATVLDNCFAGWSRHAGVRWPDRKLQAEITADSTCDYLVVYIPQDKDFIAVEPVTHMTDAFHRAAAGESDTGTRILTPGAVFSCTMAISVTIAAR